MNSSTSNSDPRLARPRPAPHLAGLLGVALPTALMTALLLAAAQLWSWAEPISGFSDLGAEANDIVFVQTTRARTLPDVDLVVVGDSAALTDVDAPLLGRLLGGCRVESVATMGYAGARGYAETLKWFFERGSRAGHLLVFVSPATIALQASTTYPDVIRDGGVAPVSVKAAPQAMLEKIRTDLLYRALLYPYPASYGEYYGGYQQFRRYIAEHAGTAGAPQRPLPGRPEGTSAWEVTYEAGWWWRESVPELARVIAEYAPDRTLAALAPIPASGEQPARAEARRAGLADLGQGLGLAADRVLTLPGTLPDPMFVDVNHLNPTGSQHYTRQLAEALSARRVCQS